MLALAVLIAAVLRFTVAGRYVYALGSNERAAELCGIGVTRLKVVIYCVAGVFFALAGLYVFCRNNQQGSPTKAPASSLRSSPRSSSAEPVCKADAGRSWAPAAARRSLPWSNSGCVPVGHP